MSEVPAVNLDKKISDLDLLSRLTHILKNGMYAILEGLYIFWVGAAFACSGWLAGLLSILAIAAVHPLRWLWDESAEVKITADTDPRVASFQKKLTVFFASAAILCDAALMAVVYFTLSPVYWFYGIVASVVITEMLHLKIRDVNLQLKTLSDEKYALRQQNQEFKSKAFASNEVWDN